MPAPKPITVVLILLLFAIVALYVLGVGLGAADNSGSGRTTMSKQELAQLRERFIKPRPVKAEELTASCPLSGGVLSVAQGGSCQVSIEEAGARARTMEVKPVAGSLTLAFTPKSKHALELPVKPLTSARKLDVDKEGAKLVLTCSAAGEQPCQVRLQ
jgi:hypothetical protein